MFRGSGKVSVDILIAFQRLWLYPINCIFNRPHIIFNLGELV